MPARLAVPVLMVRIRKMRMRVRQRCMTMRVAVPQAGLDFPIVRMLVVFVVDVLMRVLKRLVRVFMDVPLVQLHPHASGNACASQRLLLGGPLAQRDPPQPAHQMPAR